MHRIVALILVLSVALPFSLACTAQTVNRIQNANLAAIGPMSSKRAAHTATLLSNGQVLIAGGFVGDGEGLASAELFDPLRGGFRSTSEMSVARAGHTATRLPDGKILIAGGYNRDYLATAELYDPATERFTSTRRMTVGRSGHVATLLADGRVLLAGGVGNSWSFLSTAEIYDPRTGSFAPTGSMNVPRESHTVTSLPDGRVMITGGHSGRRATITIYKSSEIYDPRAGVFTLAADLTVKRHKHEAVALKDGRILIVGGSDERDGDGAYKNAEIYDPTTRRFAPVVNDMTTARYKLQGTVVVLENGKVLIAGGATRAELFDPVTNRFQAIGGHFPTKKLFATATLLSDGRVLIAGGYTDGNVVSEGAWVYQNA